MHAGPLTRSEHSGGVYSVTKRGVAGVRSRSVEEPLVFMHPGLKNIIPMQADLI